MVFNDTFNNISVISWRSVLLVGETGVLGNNHRPVTSHWQTLSYAIKFVSDLWQVSGYSEPMLFRAHEQGSNSQL
jgi:hypothetical protein